MTLSVRESQNLEPMFALTPVLDKLFSYGTWLSLGLRSNLW